MSRFCARATLVKSEAVSAGLVGDASSGHGIGNVVIE
jgi:ribosome-binding ATPase YchF (GTP1/OBG family)